VPIDTQSKKKKKALLHRTFFADAQNATRHSVRNFRIRTYRGFRNDAAQARYRFASVRNPHHRHLMNCLSISVTSVTMCNDRTIGKLGSSFSGKSHVRSGIAQDARPVSPGKKQLSPPGT
jgi:hypothetical protein